MTVAKRMEPMNVPVLVLLGFAAWTLLTLFGSIGVYRWSRILTLSPHAHARSQRAYHPHSGPRSCLRCPWCAASDGPSNRIQRIVLSTSWPESVREVAQRVSSLQRSGVRLVSWVLLTRSALLLFHAFHLPDRAGSR
jgi:hypothetical protein